MNISFAFQPLSSAKVNAESGSRPVGPSQPLALVLNRLEYSLTFAYRVKSKLLTGPIFGGAYRVISIVLTLLGLFTVTMFILKTKRHLLKVCCIMCLLTFYCFFFLFGFACLDWAIIMQKVYNASSILLILALEHFTTHEDFLQKGSGGQKIELTSRS